MKNTLKIALVVLIALFLFSSMFFVGEAETVSIKRFNKVIKTYDTPGVRLKVPVLDKEVHLERNYQLYDLKPSEVLTLDKKSMTVDSYVIWRVDKPLDFLQNTVSYNGATKKLDALVYNSIKNNISKVDQQSAITRDENLSKLILQDVQNSIKGYGMQVKDIQIKQLDLPEENKKAVYDRMISERNKMAATYTAEGKEEAEKIRNTTNKETAVLRAEAKSTAAEIKAEGESEYMRLLAESYKGADREEFYKFIRGLDALKVSMKGEKTIVLPLDSEIANLFMGK